MIKTQQRVPVRPSPVPRPSPPILRRSRTSTDDDDNGSIKSNNMASYQLSDLAYAKIIVHALKYPHARVNGVLLGSAKGKEVEIVDTIPLLHHWTNLSPMMEIGLDMTKTYAAENKLNVVGYYEAPEYIDENASVLGPTGERVVEKIREDFTNAVALVVDGSKLGKDGECALIPYMASSSNSFRPGNASSTLQLSDFIVAHVLELVRSTSLHESFGDFDDHLENVTIDWLRNGAVKDALDKE